MASQQLGEGSNDAKIVFGALEIEKRVVTTRSRTISIRNIATINVGSVVPIRSRGILLLGVMLLLGGIAYGTNARFPYSESASTLGGLAAFFGLVLIVYFAFPGDSKHYLIISGNDGTRTLFDGKQEMLEDVRRILTEKINAEDETSTFNVNFETGVIQTLNTGSVEASALVQGSNNVVAANSPGAKVATRDIALSAENSPGAQVGIGNVAQGNTSQLTRIDFSKEVAEVAKLQAYYAQVPDGADIARRLGELERLMTEGGVTAQSRSRLRDLAVDLSTVMGAMPQWANFFQSIARMAGV